MGGIRAELWADGKVLALESSLLQQWEGIARKSVLHHQEGVALEINCVRDEHSILPREISEPRILENRLRAP